MPSVFSRIRHYLIVLLAVTLAASAWPMAEFEEMDGATDRGLPSFSEDIGLTIAGPQVAQGLRGNGGPSHHAICVADFCLRHVAVQWRPTRSLERTSPTSDLHLDHNKTGPPFA